MGSSLHGASPTPSLPRDISRLTFYILTFQGPTPGIIPPPDSVLLQSMVSQGFLFSSGSSASNWQGAVNVCRMSGSARTVSGVCLSPRWSDSMVGVPHVVDWPTHILTTTSCWNVELQGTVVPKWEHVI